MTHDDELRALVERVMRDTQPGDGGCLLWTGGTNGRYGTIKHWRKRGRTVYVHRAVATIGLVNMLPWELPGRHRGLHALHHCDVPLCVNLDHLWIGRTRDNTADMVAKGRASERIARALAVQCIRGHPLSGDNLYLNANGTRKCRACGADRARRYRAAT